MSDAWPVASGMRTGVIDIGSNSIRLVVFDGLNRAPLPIINHKAVIGLGVDVERLGHLGVEAFRSGIETVDALVRIAQSVPVADLALYATAAVRDAANGSDFCRSIETRTGYAVKVLSGDEEARLSALGVISAVPELTGVVGDLGGGSLELVAVRRGIIMERSTLGIGPLRMMERWGADPGDSESQIAEAFDKVAWLADWKYHCFHAVGGSWRAIARLHMEQHDYPLKIVHGYSMTRSGTRDFARMLENLSHETISRIRAISRRRASILPWGAKVLVHLLRVLKPSVVIYSAHGLREGHHFDMLDPVTRAEDPLLAACRELADRHRRFPDCSAALERWLQPVSSRFSHAEERLVRAACILADTGWREHPAYRALRSLSRVLHMPWSVLDHSQRAWLALALFVRYGGSSSGNEALPCHRLLEPESAAEARILGLMLRLALELCAGRGQVLESTPVAATGKGFHLEMRADAAVASLERIERYVASASRALDAPFTMTRHVVELTDEAPPPCEPRAATSGSVPR